VAIRIDTAFQAVYIFEPDGHNVPALNTPLCAAGLLRATDVVTPDSLVCGFYGVSTGTLNYWGLFKNAGGNVIQLRGYNGALVTSSNYTLPVGDHRLSIEHDAGTIRARLDGAVILSMAFVPMAGTPGDRSFQIGGYGEDPGIINSTIARWRMWSAVLTQTELRAEFRSLGPLRMAGLLHNWPMNPGATRLVDTVSGQPPMLDNPAVPVGDGTAFVLRASIIGTPQFFDLGQTTTPGAQTIDVPTFAERVVMVFNQSDDASTPDSNLASLTSNFAGTFTLDRAVATTVAQAVAVAVATVTTPGAGRTFTPVLTAANPVAGAGCWVVFLQDVLSGSTIATNKAQATGAGATPGTASAAGVVDGLAVAADTRLDATSGNYPANQTDWESLGLGQTTGAFTYWASSRFRQKPVTATGTESATTQNTNGSCIGLATITSRAPTNTGTLNATLGALSRTMTGTVRVTGTLAQTLGGLGLVATGHVDSPTRHGILNATLGSLQASSTGTVRVAGAAAVTLGPVALSATGAVAASGSVAATLGPLTLVAAATGVVAGSLAATLGPVTLAAVGVLPIVGTLGVTLGGIGLVASGVVGAAPVIGTLAVTLGSMTAVGTGTVGVAGTLTRTLGEMTAASAGTVAVAGALTQTLGGLGLVATGVVGAAPVFGQLSVTLGALGLQATGSVPATGQLAMTLGPVALAASGGVRVAGTLAQTLGSLSLVATGFNGNGVNGQLAVTLGVLTLVATGVTSRPVFSKARTVRVAAENRTVRVRAENRTVKVRA